MGGKVNEDRQRTEWDFCCHKSPSGFRDGGPMRHDEWLAAEQARLAERGVKTEIRRVATPKGEQAALFGA